MRYRVDSLPNFTLSLAAEKGEESLHRAMFTYGLDVNSPNECGVTPLHSAAGDGKLQAVEILLKNGANVNARCRGLDTPLHWACTGASYKNTEEIVNCLIASGANCTLRDESRRTPLNVAKMYRNKAVISAVKLQFDIQTGERCARCHKYFGWLIRMFKYRAGIFDCKECKLQYCIECARLEGSLFFHKKISSGTCFKCCESNPIPPIQWTKELHLKFPGRIRLQIKTMLMLASRDSKSGKPFHPEALLHKLPKEILGEICHFLVEESR